jgi:hypothetical protein
MKFALGFRSVGYQLDVHYKNYNNEYVDDVFMEDFKFCLKYPKLNRYPVMRNFIHHYGEDAIRAYLGMPVTRWGRDAS